MGHFRTENRWEKHGGFSIAIDTGISNFFPNLVRMFWTVHFLSTPGRLWKGGFSAWRFFMETCWSKWEFLTTCHDSVKIMDHRIRHPPAIYHTVSPKIDPIRVILLAQKFGDFISPQHHSENLNNETIRIYKAVRKRWGYIFLGKLGLKKSRSERWVVSAIVGFA